MAKKTEQQEPTRFVDVGFAQLHGDLFLNGKNLTKGGVHHNLDTHNNPNLKMVYDTVEKELLVTWNNVTAHVPSTNVASYIPGPAADRKVMQTASPQVSNIAGAQIDTPSTTVQNPRPTAQVSTPQSHVHAGLGHGQR